MTKTGCHADGPLMVMDTSVVAAALFNEADAPILESLIA
jgi:hypothetical protein